MWNRINQNYQLRRMMTGLYCTIVFLTTFAGAADSRYILPHYTFVDGGWETSLSLVNPDPKPLSVSIKAFGNNGNHMDTIVISLPAGSGLDANVKQLLSGSVEEKGWLELTAASENLRGLMRFSRVSTGGTSSLPLLRETGPNWLLPLLENDSIQQSGYAVTNTEDTPINVEVILTSLDGLFSRSEKLALSAHAKKVAMLTDQFGTDIPSKTNLTIKASGPITAFALTFRDQIKQIIAVPGSPYSPTDTAINTFFEHTMAQAGVPALSAAVVANGEVIWTKGFGHANIEKNRRATAQTPFLLASISKAITAVAFIKAWEENYLEISDPINNLLPFSVDNPNVSGESITHLDLLTHTSSIADNQDVADQVYVYGTDSPIALGRFLEDYFTLGGRWYDAEENFLFDPPGQENEYSNIGTALAGYLIELAVGLPMDKYCENKLFIPLALNNTGWHLSDFNPEDIASPYEVAFNGELQNVGHFSFPDYPNGQCRSSASDLARLLAVIMNGGVLNGVRLLEPLSVVEMLKARNVPLDPNDDSFLAQGLLWFSTSLLGPPVTGHDGGEQGTTTYMWFNPATSIGVVLLANGAGEGINDEKLIEILKYLFHYGESLSL